MSFDEKENLDNDEIDLVEWFNSIWFNKFSLLIFILLSIPLSLMFATTITPTYKAKAVFEKPKISQNTSSLMDRDGGPGLLRLLTLGPVSGARESFYSEIRSTSLLKTVILNNAELDSRMLQKFCPLPSIETSRVSLRSLLISLGISENKVPSESQKTSLLVECVNGMLEIGPDRYGDNKSSAYKLTVESADPNFSANLANQIVEKYFERHEAGKDEEFKNVKRYLAKVIAEAQLEFTEANKLIQQFIIEHTLLMNLKLSSSQNANNVTLGNQISMPASPFARELNKEVANLSQLEKSLSQLNEAMLKLSELKELDQEKIKAFISSTEVQTVFSRNFVTSISKIDAFSVGIGSKNKVINKIVRQELENLNQQIQVIKDKIGKKERQTMQLMNIENRFQALAIDVSKKKLIFEGLKDQLKEKILASGLANIGKPILLTRAVPPFRKESPNRTLIVALGVILSVFAGIAFILIRQNSLRKVYSLSQIRNLSRSLSCYEIKYKQLKRMGERFDEVEVSQSFFSRTMERGKLGCIIDISQKKMKKSLSSDFSKAFASLLAMNSSKIVCLNTLTSMEPFSTSSQKNFTSDHNVHDPKGVPNERIFTFNDEEGMIDSGEINKIKNKYSDYDKIICALGAEIGDLKKYKFIEQCDFYILIGRSSHFDEYAYKKFSNTVWEKEKKCLGFFLVN